MKELVLIRHGQSAWNLENRFTGWVDVDLSDRGVGEARDAGKTLRGERLPIRRRHDVTVEALDPHYVADPRRDGPDVPAGANGLAAE